MSKLNIYKIFRKNKIDNKDEYFESLIKKENKVLFVIDNYYVVANSKTEAKSIKLPFQEGFNLDWISKYFDMDTLLELTYENKDIKSKTWPSKMDYTENFQRKNEILDIGYNSNYYPGNFKNCNKLDFDNIMEYVSGGSQLLMINMYVYNSHQNKYIFQKLIAPKNFNHYLINRYKHIEFMDWIIKPLNQLTKRIFNHQPEKIVELWNTGILNPNCDPKDEKCNSKICIHILSDYYCKKIDVSLMVDLLLLFYNSNK
jgi:hypothetical protein